MSKEEQQTVNYTFFRQYSDRGKRTAMNISYQTRRAGWLELADNYIVNRVRIENYNLTSGLLQSRKTLQQKKCKSLSNNMC